MKKKALLSSVLTIVLCLSLIAGSTFALFTSKSDVNVAVTSGKVDVVATATEPTLTWDSRLDTDKRVETAVSVNNNIVTLDKLLPGATVSFNINITNNSDVTVQYRTVIKMIEDNGLWSGLKVTIDDNDFDGTTVKTAWTTLTTSDTVASVSVKVEFPYDASNEYQGKSCKFAYTVEAVQGNAKPASEWDGETTTAPGTDDNNVYHITNAAELVYVMNATQNSTYNAYQSKTISLDTDIDLGGATVAGFGAEATHWFGTFDGNGHTISNFTISRDGKACYAGLFNYVYDGTVIQNVTVKDATVVGDAFVGAVAAAIYNGGTVKNCHAINCTVAGEKKVGSVVGFNQNATVKDCSATNCAVYCEVSADIESSGIKPQADEVVGFSIKDGNAYPEGNINCTYDNVTVTFNASYITNGVLKQGDTTYLISNASGLEWFNDQVNNHANSFGGYTLKLTADIDMNGAEWLPVGQNYTLDYAALGYANPTEFKGTFDGDGHTISNIKIGKLTAEQVKQLNDNTAESGRTTDHAIHSVGFIGFSSGSTVKNLTIKNATVTGYHNVGTIVGYCDVQTTIDNCHVESSAVSGTHLTDDQCGDKVGGLVGFYNNGERAITNCSVKGSTVTAARNAAKVIGYADGITGISNISADNVTVTANSTGCSHGRVGIVSANALVGNGTATGYTLD